MSNHPHLKNAPIVEAALDFRCPSTKEIDWQATDLILKTELTDYPKFDMLRSFSGEIKVEVGKGNSSASVSDLGRVGTRLCADDGQQVVQFKKEGFVFSKLKPYVNWEGFVNEAFRLWEFHRKIFCPSDIVRIGVRFINRVEIQKMDELPGALKINPILPKEYNADIKKFLNHYSFGISGKPYFVNLIQTVDLPINASKLGVVLDVDVSIKGLFPDLSIVKKHLNDMREIKNDVFFNSFTEMAINKMGPE